ncbi:MAG: cupin domain-containing protein [Ferruginibacter sp.]|nr:cupin domain-containing protein [Ferruginibacter sp.]
MNHFISLSKLAAVEAVKGGFLSAVQTENLTIAYTSMKAGAEIPLHHHPEDAVDIMLEGILEMQIGEITEIIAHGMITIVPSNMPHKAKAITECNVITIFYPRRVL